MGQAVGEAIHEALETWLLTSDPSSEAERQRQRISARLAARLTGAELEAAEQRARQILDALANGEILARLVARRDDVVARELPILLPPDDEPFGPIAGISGVIDLLLRDPESGELLVVDYKTDQVDDEQALAERAAHYHPQLATYAEALKQALDLDNAPPTELWFVTSDRVWRSS